MRVYAPDLLSLVDSTSKNNLDHEISAGNKEEERPGGLLFD